MTLACYLVWEVGSELEKCLEAVSGQGKSNVCHQGKDSVRTCTCVCARARVRACNGLLRKQLSCAQTGLGITMAKTSDNLKTDLY